MGRLLAKFLNGGKKVSASHNALTNSPRLKALALNHECEAVISNVRTVSHPEYMETVWRASRRRSLLNQAMSLLLRHHRRSAQRDLDEYQSEDPAILG